MSRGVAGEVLEQLRAAAAGLSSRHGPSPPRYPRFFAPLLLAAIAAVSTPGLLAAPVAAIASSLPLVAAYARGPRRGLLAAPLVAAVFAAAVSAPLLATGGATVAAGFVARAAAAASLSAAAVAAAGWSCLGLPGFMAEWAWLLLLSLHVLAGTFVRLAAAREARRLGRGGLVEEWRLRAGLVAAVLDASLERSQRVALAARARGLRPEGWRGGCGGGSLVPYLPLALTLVAALMEAAGAVP